MTVLFPGTVAFYIPYRILAPIEWHPPADLRFGQFLAAGTASDGLAILLRCVWDFAHLGRGTLAPFDEPRKLVVRGPYRYVRNPMYIGVILILLGESWFFGSFQLLLYAGLCFIMANIFVIGYEEKRLRTKSGEDYEHYGREVGRWIPRVATRQDQIHLYCAMRATSEFDVTGGDQTPYADLGGGGHLSRATVRKSFRGDLEGESTAELLMCQTDPDDYSAGAGYVATEVVTGRLDGRRGTFVIQHWGLMGGGEEPWTDGRIIPGSGTDDLEGIRGSVLIKQAADGTHSMTIEYELPWMADNTASSE